jgi:hypothetical protein
MREFELSDGFQQFLYCGRRINRDPHAFFFFVKKSVRKRVGLASMEYSTRCRILLAGKKPTNSNDPISVITCRSAPNQKRLHHGIQVDNGPFVTATWP